MQDKKQEKMSTMAILSLVFGIIGLISSCLFIGILPSLMGLIFGTIALIKKDKRDIGGIICSVVGLIIAGLMIAWIIVEVSKENEVEDLIENGNYEAAIGMIENNNFSDSTEKKFYYDIYVGQEKYDDAFWIIFSDIEKDYENIDSVSEEERTRLSVIYDFVSSENQNKIDQFEADREALLIEKAEEEAAERAKEEAKKKAEEEVAEKAKEKAEEEAVERVKEEEKEKAEKEAAEKEKISKAHDINNLGFEENILEGEYVAFDCKLATFDDAYAIGDNVLVTVPYIVNDTTGYTKIETIDVYLHMKNHNDGEKLRENRTVKIVGKFSGYEKKIDAHLLYYDDLKNVPCIIEAEMTQLDYNILDVMKEMYSVSIPENYSYNDFCRYAEPNFYIDIYFSADVLDIDDYYWVCIRDDLAEENYINYAYLDIPDNLITGGRILEGDNVKVKARLDGFTTDYKPIFYVHEIY